MDAYNLAICFGPTLMPAPEEKDQVQCQNQVNDLIKNMIVYHEDLFPKDLGGTIYEKYISQEPFDCDVGDSPTEQVTEDPDSEVYPSEDGKLIAILNGHKTKDHTEFVLQQALRDVFLLEKIDLYSNFLQSPTQWRRPLNLISLPVPIVNCHCAKVI